VYIHTVQIRERDKSERREKTDSERRHIVREEREDECQSVEIRNNNLVSNREETAEQIEEKKKI